METWHKDAENEGSLYKQSASQKKTVFLGWFISREN